LGAQKSEKTSQNPKNIEEFLAGLGFEQRWKFEEIQIDLFSEYKVFALFCNIIPF